jgi:hypothetical protein
VPVVKVERTEERQGGDFEQGGEHGHSSGRRRNPARSLR